MRLPPLRGAFFWVIGGETGQRSRGIESDAPSPTPVIRCAAASAVVALWCCIALRLRTTKPARGTRACALAGSCCAAQTHRRGVRGAVAVDEHVICSCRFGVLAAHSDLRRVITR